MLLTPIHPIRCAHADTRPVSGFSLIELLAVISIIGVLAGISSLSLSGNASSAQLRTAGVQCANLMESARESAALRKTPVAVAFLPANGDAPAALASLALDSESGSWVRISPWEKLPVGVALDPTSNVNSNCILGSNSPVVSPALPSLDYAGSRQEAGGVAGYGYLIFMPNGALHQSNTQPGFLRLVSGIAHGTTLQRTGLAENYFEVVVNPSTGRLKYRQPQ